MKYVMLMFGCLMVSSLCGVESIPFDEMKKEDTFVPLEKASDESFVFHTTGIVTNLPGSPPPLASNEEKKNDAVIRLNTSNEFKFNEFKRLFTKFGNLKLERTKVDLDEIDVRVSFIKTLSLSFCILTHSLPQARPALVVAQKATSAGVNVLIEDTSLDVEGAEVGVNIRWIMDNLKDLIGRRAVWRVMLGILRSDQKVYIYEGITNGVIVKARGDSAFGFDPVFLPEGSTKTLAEDKPDSVSARCKAVEAMMNDDAVAIHCPIKKEDWKGKWQH